MNIAERPVLLLHSDRVFCERVRRACAQRFQLRVVPSWDALRETIQDAAANALVVVDPYEGTFGDEHLSPTLRALLREFPSTTVLAACGVRRGCFEDVRTLGEWGVSRVISLDEEDTPVAIAQRLSAAQGRPLRTLIRRALPPNVPGRAQAILMAASEIVSVGGAASDLARSLHVTTRTLLRWCRRASLPPPRRLLAWMRILLAAELLDDPGRSVLGVAFACGYTSDSALRLVMRRYLGVTPGALRTRGAFAVASRAFVEALARERRASPPPASA